MDLTNQILLWLHYVALAVGGAAAFGIPVVGSQMASADADMRKTLFAISKRLSSIGRGGMAVLIITGPLLVWLKYGGMDGLSVWFWIKMVLLAALLVNIVYSGLSAKKAEAGDMAAAQRLPMLSIVAIVLLLGVVLSAVLAFS